MAEFVLLSVAILGLVETTSRVTTRVRGLTVQVKDSDRELSRLAEELEILTEVLDECHETFKSTSSAPASVERSMNLCMSRHAELMYIVHKDIRRAETMSIISRIKTVFRQQERRIAYNAFRDSVLLLRDLASELRTKQQFLQISATMAEVMADDWGNIDLDADPAQEGDRVGIDEYFDNNPSPGNAPEPRKDGLLRQKSALREFAELARGNWTRNVVINVDTGNPGPARFVYVPAREKSDTASDLNLIDLDLLEKAGIDKNLMKPAPHIEINGVVEGVTLTPEFQVELSWYVPRGMKSSIANFLVIRNATFDVLIGSRKVSQNLRASTMITVGRRKTKEETRIENENRARQLREARVLEETQLQPAKIARAERDQALPTANQALPTANQALPTANQALPIANQALPAANHPLPAGNVGENGNAIEMGAIVRERHGDPGVP